MFDNPRFLIQTAVIVGFSHLIAAVFHRFRQPHVIGEMFAGLLLGPTFFGFLAPNAFNSLFPPESLGFLKALSQAGLVVFIFLIGVRVNFAELRLQSRVAIITSNVGVILPLLMGISLAQYLYPRYGSGDRLAFSLFIGTAMSVTAFPVLARILLERNLLETSLGAVALACAAVDDITAWTLLAVIVAITKHDQNSHPLGMMFIYLAIYLAAMLILRRVLNAWANRVDEKKVPLNAMLLFVALAFVSAAIGEWIGIHAMVGAFIAGLVTPRKFRQQLVFKLEGLTLFLLIPIFFALAGVQTNLIFSNGSASYADLMLILLVALVSKWGGTTIGARTQGMSLRDSCQLGLLMNTRGLVELVVLSVGLELGILSSPLFSMMVCMALVTTLMAAPLMDLFRRT